MSNDSHESDPMDFLKTMWGNMGFSLPGMVAPTLDIDELGRRIADLKAVEGWLKMNLNTLQMSIQGLEMQRVALTTVQTMGKAAQAAAAQHSGDDAASAAVSDVMSELANNALNTALNPALWPWNFMHAPAADEKPAAAQTTTKKPRRAATTKSRKS